MKPEPSSTQSSLPADETSAGAKTISTREPELVTATKQELDDILARCRAALSPQQFLLLERVLESFVFLTLKLQNARVSLGSLRRLLFGPRTERLRDVAKDALDGDASPVGAAPGERAATTEASTIGAEGAAADSVAVVTRRHKGHGRNGADAYRGAEVVECMHAELASGQRCPQCGQGRIYDWVPRTLVRVTGQAPLAATVYRLEQLRCRMCDAVFTAPAPSGVAEAPKYDASCASMLALLRYGSGVPFYRLEGLQASLQLPLPDSTQWEIVSQAVPAPQKVYEELVRVAAQARLLHNDDTPMRVLELMAERRAAEGRGDDDVPKAIQTTGIVAEVEASRVVLFFTGHAHAGVNLQTLLAKRAQELPAPLQMCDALAANVSGELATVVCKCLAHGRRKVIDVLEHFPEQALHIIERLAEVYGHDAHCREHALSDAQRLAWHQEHSAPVMAELHAWMSQRLALHEVEPNSGLGEALKYLIKHWDGLTRFLHREGAPLDNTACERALKRAVLHRKNSMFYKTSTGAKVGDVYMSLIATCTAAGVNAFEYLRALHLHAERVKADAASWLPWNYRLQLAEPAAAADVVAATA